jgi:exodeoxyribonuclease VII large subunit
MWRSSVARLTQQFNSGDAVLAHGAVSIYEVSGRLQLYADTVQPAGVGLLQARFEELRARLEAEGLFDPSRKRALPPLPRRIGVATSAQGAALRDILNVLARRYPLAEVLIAPCQVQGERGAASIVRALHTLYDNAPDLIILARGGGSMEDLWCFNEEAVARAVFAAPVPLISGVGHETDTTIVDFVADIRAPTPSAAAELAVPDVAALAQDTGALRQRLDEVMQEFLDTRQQALVSSENALKYAHPGAKIAQARQQVDEQMRRAADSLGHALELRRIRLAGARSHLDTLSPLATLGRGYAVVRHAESGQAVTHISHAQAGDRLIVTLSDGYLTVEVQDLNTLDPRGDDS